MSNYPSNDYTNNGLWQLTNVYQSYNSPSVIINKDINVKKIDN